MGTLMISYLSRIFHKALGKFAHQSSSLLREGRLGKVYFLAWAWPLPYLRRLLGQLGHQSAQIYCSVCKKCGLSRTKPIVWGLLCLSLMWVEAYAVTAIPWELPPQDISVSRKLLMPHSFDMNNLGQAAVSYFDSVTFQLKIAIKDKEGAWVQTLPAGYTGSINSANIGINDQSNLLAVWSSGGSLYYATANFDDLMLAGSWTISSVAITGIVHIQSFDFNNAGKAIIFRNAGGGLLIAHVFNGTSWDNTINPEDFGSGNRPTATINNSGQILAIWSASGLKYRTRTVDGSWDDDNKVITDLAITASSQTLSFNNSGQAVASWRDSGSGNMRVATYDASDTFGDAAWSVLEEASTVDDASIRALINDNGQIISSWYDGSNLQVRTGPFATPLANGTQIPTKFGYVGALNENDIAAFVLTTSINISNAGPLSAVTFDASDLSFSTETSLVAVNVDIFFQAAFIFKAATNTRGDWLVLWMLDSSGMLQTTYAYVPTTTISAEGEQVTVRYATCKEYVNRLHWSVVTTESLSFYRIYRDGQLIGTSQVLEFNDREQKREVPRTYTIEAINQGGSVSGTTTVVVP